MEEIVDTDSSVEEFDFDFDFNKDIKAAMNSKELLKLEYLEYKKSFRATFFPKSNGLCKLFKIY